MIGKLKGTLHEIHGQEALIETSGGVYYRVHVSPTLLGSENSDIEIYTYLNVREDELTLFGFETYEKYRVFILFIAIDGVGPKTAFLIVSTTTPTEIRKAVHANDVAFFQKIKGIGKKTAQRILVDLSDKLGAEFDVNTLQENPDDADALEALVSLGFKKAEALKALEKVDSSLPIEERIKLALQSVNR